MTDEDLAGAIVSALWPTSSDPSSGSGVVATSAHGWDGPHRQVTDRELAAALTPPRAAPRGPGPIVVVERLSATGLRAVRARAPSLLVWTGDAPDTATPLDALASTGAGGTEVRGWVLGPGARVKVSPLGPESGAADRIVACAHNPGELEGLCRALGPERVLLAISPTPPWLPGLLTHPRLREVRVSGYVPRTSLGTHWLPWIRAHRRQVVLVPVDVHPPQLTDPPQTLEAAAAAQALERLTGPVFPAPRVISLVLAGLSAPADAGVEPASPDLALWAQARRALPITGTTPGMEGPRSGLPLDAPTATFLAQRALLRAEETSRSRDARPPELEPLDDEALERASEVMRGAGETLTDHEAKVILRSYGFEVTRQAVASSASGAAGFADRIGYPVALKALSPDLARRRDLGGVVLDLDTAAAVRRAYGSIVTQIEERAPTARLDGVVVSEMIPPAADVRIGVRKTSAGTYLVHARPDAAPPAIETALALLPLDPGEALAFAHSVWAFTSHPDRDRRVRELAVVFLRLVRLVEHVGERLQRVELGPLRIGVDDRPPVVLDASLTQAPHLEGL